APCLAAQLSTAVLATQAFQHDADLLLQQNDAGVWLCEYPGLSFQCSPVCACSLVSSLLLSGATMCQQSSLTQSAHSVRQVLTAYNQCIIFATQIGSFALSEARNSHRRPGGRDAKPSESRTCGPSAQPG